MNYSIRSINPITDQELLENYSRDKAYSSGEYTAGKELVGSKFRIEIEIIHEDSPLYITLLCGSISGVMLEHSPHNYATIEAYPEFLKFDIQDTLEWEFKYIIDRHSYIDEGEKAQAYLLRKGLNAILIEASVAIQYPDDIVIHLTKRDIKYYAALEDEYQVERLAR